MHIVEALILIGVIALALNHAGGGKPHHVIRPATGILNSLARFGFKSVTQIGALLFQTICRSARLPGVSTFKTGGERGFGPPPSRWRE